MITKHYKRMPQVVVNVHDNDSTEFVELIKYCYYNVRIFYELNSEWSNGE